MNKIMLSLGNYAFSINTAAYQSLQRTVNYRWSKQERLASAPSRQFFRGSDETITLQGVIYPEFAGGLGQIDLMRREAEKGEPLHLLNVSNFLKSLSLGRWVIDSISDTNSLFLPGGAPLKIEFNIKLSLFSQESDTLNPYFSGSINQISEAVRDNILNA